MINHVRVSKNAVQAETLVLSDDRGRTITLVGVMHVADPESWRKLNEFIATMHAQGHEIHYELVNGELRNADAASRALGRMKKAMGTLMAKDRAAGLVYQIEGLVLPPDARNTDMDVEQFKTAFAKVAWYVPLQLMLSRLFFRVIPAKVHRELLAALLVSADFGNTDPGGMDDAIILGERNRIASEAALKTDAPVIAIWGAAHLEGIVQNLTEAGYSVIHRQWRTVFEFTPRFIFSGA